MKALLIVSAALFLIDAILVIYVFLFARKATKGENKEISKFLTTIIIVFIIITVIMLLSVSTVFIVNKLS